MHILRSRGTMDWFYMTSSRHSPIEWSLNYSRIKFARIINYGFRGIITCSPGEDSNVRIISLRMGIDFCLFSVYSKFINGASG